MNENSMIKLNRNNESIFSVKVHKEKYGKKEEKHEKGNQVSNNDLQLTRF